jgi:hypothetical protein
MHTRPIIGGWPSSIYFINLVYLIILLRKFAFLKWGSGNKKNIFFNYWIQLVDISCFMYTCPFLKKLGRYFIALVFTTEALLYCPGCCSRSFSSLWLEIYKQHCRFYTCSTYSTTLSRISMPSTSLSGNKEARLTETKLRTNKCKIGYPIVPRTHIQYLPSPLLNKVKKKILCQKPCPFV